jgi:hypothetical protein
MRTSVIMRRPLLLFLAVCLCANVTSACDILVRDAAFRTPRDMHRLCVMAESGDPAADEIETRLGGWLDQEAIDLNLELVRVNADDPDVRWSDFGIPSAPPVLPVTVLVGTNRETGVNFVIQHWEPAPTDEELAALAGSPLREQLQRELGRQLAVVLYAPCLDCEDDRVPAMLNLVGREWQDVQGTGLGVSVIEVDRTDPAERLLLSFAGVAPDGPDWVGVVFGRGKLMNPPLIGEEITPAALNGLLEQVLADCSCSKPLPSMGVDLPMVWTAELDDQVVALGAPAEDVGTQAVRLGGLSPARLVSQSESQLASDAARTSDVSIHDTDFVVTVPEIPSIYKWILRSLLLIIIGVAATSWWLLQKKVG